MSRSLLFSAQAITSLENIGYYIFREFGQVYSQEYKTRIAAAFEELELTPQRSATIFVQKLQGRFSKKVVYGRTIILFTYTDTQVFIAALYDARTNWKG